ncbi:AtpZ/AtpI family protein [bacterium]|nr:AtpZ/AtpI family protein [bacterium]
MEDRNSTDVDSTSHESIKARIERENFNSFWAISQVGWQTAICILIGLAIDRYFDSMPWGTLACVLIGVVTSTTLLLQTAFRTLARSRENSSEASSSSGPSSPSSSHSSRD